MIIKQTSMASGTAVLHYSVFIYVFIKTYVKVISQTQRPLSLLRFLHVMMVTRSTALYCIILGYIAMQKKLECGPMPNVMVALPNIGGALCSTPQSLADVHYLTAVQ